MSRADYRQFLPQPGQSRIAGKTAREHTENRMKTERTQTLFSEWDALGKEPFHGITTDGSIAEGLFPLNNDGVPSQTIAETATNVLSRLDDAQRRKMQFPVEAAVWRKSVEAFSGEGNEFARWVFLKKIAQAFRTMMVNTADSPLMDVFGDFGASEGSTV